jgi:diaminopimelate epimerase
MTTPHPFYKANGTGNTFIIVLPSPSSTTSDLKALTIRLCNLTGNTDIDSLLVLTPNSQPTQPHSKWYMRVFNKDGSFAEMCGNGLRCVAGYLRKYGYEEADEFYVRTDAGMKKCKVYEV